MFVSEVSFIAMKLIHTFRVNMLVQLFLLSFTKMYDHIIFNFPESKLKSKLVEG
jgi:hypothetical protein